MGLAYRWGQLGLSWRRKNWALTTARVTRPVERKLADQLQPAWSSRLHSTREKMLPQLALVDHSPITRAFLCSPNQLPMIATCPGRAVDWKKPAATIARKTKARLKRAATSQRMLKLMQAVQEAVRPKMTQNLRGRRWARLPRRAMPAVQAKRKRASTQPSVAMGTPNCWLIYALEKDQPSRMQWMLAQPRKVSKKGCSRPVHIEYPSNLRLLFEPRSLFRQLNIGTVKKTQIILKSSFLQCSLLRLLLEKRLLLAVGEHVPEVPHEEGQQGEAPHQHLRGEQVEDVFEGHVGDDDHLDGREEGADALDEGRHLRNTALLPGEGAQVDDCHRREQAEGRALGHSDEEQGQVVLPGRRLLHREGDREHQPRADEHQRREEEGALVEQVAEVSEEHSRNESAHVLHGRDEALLGLDRPALVVQVGGQPEDEPVDRALEADHAHHVVGHPWQRQC